MLNFNHIYYFHVVASEGSVAKAAEKLGLAQPTVSEQIRQLERSLETLLFQRTSSGLKLTQTGRTAFAQTSVMFQAADRLVSDLSTAEDVVHALKIGISVSASRYVAAEFLTPLLQIPDCRPIIRTGDAMEMLRRLRDHELDLLIAEDDVSSISGLVARELYRPQLVVIAAPNAPENALQSLPLLNYLPESALRWEVETFVRAHAAKLQVLAETDDVPLMLEAVARGTCIAAVPRGMARGAIDQKRVRVVAELPRSSVALSAIVRDGKADERATYAAGLLVDFAREHFGAGESNEASSSP